MATNFCPRYNRGHRFSNWEWVGGSRSGRACLSEPLLPLRLRPLHRQAAPPSGLSAPGVRTWVMGRGGHVFSLSPLPTLSPSPSSVSLSLLSASWSWLSVAIKQCFPSLSKTCFGACVRTAKLSDKKQGVVACASRQGGGAVTVTRKVYCPASQQVTDSQAHSGCFVPLSATPRSMV